MTDRKSPVKSLSFECPNLDGSIEIEPSSVAAGRVSFFAEDGGQWANVQLEKAQAVAAALQIIACALGSAAALDAERAVAGHLRPAPMTTPAKGVTRQDVRDAAHAAGITPEQIDEAAARLMPSVRGGK